jgi:dsRNA-specific ribonuclease
VRSVLSTDFFRLTPFSLLLQILDYVQLVHNHIKDYTFEEVDKGGPSHKPWFEYRLLGESQQNLHHYTLTDHILYRIVKGIEQTKGTGGRVNDAKKVAAYKYLKQIKFVSRDDKMEARL